MSNTTRKAFEMHFVQTLNLPSSLLARYAHGPWQQNDVDASYSASWVQLMWEAYAPRIQPNEAVRLLAEAAKLNRAEAMEKADHIVCAVLRFHGSPEVAEAFMKVLKV